ncbi:MAG TPA: cytochrome D1 domain-containing protein [Terriglobales bacterium]|nr:cytochrome D1 domain-containing protein [Terriglobales bacterium]
MLRFALVLITLSLSAAFLLVRTRAVEADASLPLLLVANKGDHTLGLIDPQAGRQIATVDEAGVTGHEVIASPDGRIAYVPIYGDSGVGLPGSDGRNLAVVDLASRKVTGNVNFGHGVRPHCPMIGPKDGLLYVTTELDKSVTIIDPHTLKIVGSVPTTQPESHMLAITRDGRRGYTANVGPGTVSVLDLEARKTIAVIPVAPRIQRIALSVDDRLVFTSDQTKSQLAVIDTATNKVTTWVQLPAQGYGTAPTPDGRWLVVALRTGNQVAVVDLKTMKVVHTIDVPAVAQEVLIPPDGSAAYVSCDASHKIAVIRVSDWTVERLIDAGPGTDGLAWAASK